MQTMSFKWCSKGCYIEAIEVFLNTNSEVKDKIADFTIQVEKIYYTAFEKTEDNKFICYNYEKPNEKHIDDVNYIEELKDRIFH